MSGLTLELVRGVLDDLYMIARGHDAVFYGVFALVHLAVIVTGVFLIRRGERPGGEVPATRPATLAGS